MPRTATPARNASTRLAPRTASNLRRQADLQVDVLNVMVAALGRDCNARGDLGGGQAQREEAEYLSRSLVRGRLAFPGNRNCRYVLQIEANLAGSVSSGVPSQLHRVSI